MTELLRRAERELRDYREYRAQLDGYEAVRVEALAGVYNRLVDGMPRPPGPGDSTGRAGTWLAEQSRRIAPIRARVQAIENTVNRMAPRDRRFVVLRYVECRTMRQCADALSAEAKRSDELVSIATLYRRRDELVALIAETLEPIWRLEEGVESADEMKVIGN